MSGGETASSTQKPALPDNDHDVDQMENAPLSKRQSASILTNEESSLSSIRPSVIDDDDDELDFL